MTTLSIEHAKHIVRLRHKDAHVPKRQERDDFDKYPVLADFHCMGTKSRTGCSYQHLGKGISEDAAWIDAALHILADPEFWLDDERVVRAAVPDSWEGPDGSVWSSTTQPRRMMGNEWPEARIAYEVIDFEQQYRPQDDRASRTPAGGNPEDFCECDHHEMNHANYAGMTRACNQTGCGCRDYRPKDEKPMSEWSDEEKNASRNRFEVYISDFGYDLTRDGDTYIGDTRIAWAIWQAALSGLVSGDAGVEGGKLAPIDEGDVYKLMRRTLARKEVDALMVTRWKDGIDLEEVSGTFLSFLAEFRKEVLAAKGSRNADKGDGR